MRNEPVFAAPTRHLTKRPLEGHMAQRPEYFVWKEMHRRCSPNHQSFKHYGGRGITVCERWNVFANFIADMGPRPHPKLTLERINNDGNYEPGNCRWATWKEQYANKRKQRWDKLNAEKVRAIRADPRRPYRIIATDYGVTRHMIGMVIRGDCWKDI
jgi:hypothetical protein